MLASYVSAGAQDKSEKIMELRAREIHKVIGLDNREAWKNFINENYTEEFINKQSSRRRVIDSEEKSETASKDKGTDKLDAKVDLFQMLHQDFGGSKLVSLTFKDNIATMVLSNMDGLRGTFKLTYQKQAPYLIDNMSVEANMDR